MAADKTFLGLMTALFTVAGGLLASIYVIDMRENAHKTALSSTFNNAVFSLEGAHAVTADYEGRKYTYNFDNNTVMGGHTRGAGLGGAGYGGMVSFESFEDKKAIETARVQGCKIAASMAIAENPGWPETEDFEVSRAKAVRFTATYCP